MPTAKITYGAFYWEHHLGVHIISDSEAFQVRNTQPLLQKCMTLLILGNSRNKSNTEAMA